MTASENLSDFRPIFVVGHPRSGTTLLAELLGRNSNIAATPETAFFTDVVHRIRKKDLKNPSVLRRKIFGTRLKDLDTDRVDIEKWLSAETAISLRQTFAATLQQYAEKRGKTRVLEKTPLHLRHIDEILNWYPKSKIIWIVRDGRACIGSIRKIYWGSQNFRDLCRQYNRNIAFGLDAEKRHSASMLRVYYEDLLNDRRAVMQTIHDFLEIEFEPEQLQPRESSEVVPEWENSWKEKVTQAIDPRRATAWETELSEEERHLSTLLMRRTLVKLGYPLKSDTLSPSGRSLRDILQSIVDSHIGLGLQKAAYAARLHWLG